jgi:hypothetical protein
MWALKLMYIKLPMHLFFYGAGSNGFLAGKYALLGPVIGVGPEFSTFLDPNGTRFARAIPGPKKVSNSGPTPITGPRNAYFPPEIHYVPLHKNNRYINSYFKFKGTSSFKFNKTGFSLHLLQKIASFYHFSTLCKNLVAG